MASHLPQMRPRSLDSLLTGGPVYWLGLLALASPWLRFAVGPWTLYPGHVAMGVLLAAVLLSEPGWSGALRPLAPLLALGGYLAAVSALRGEWQAALALAGVTAAHFAWGAAAMRVGLAPGRAGALREGLAGLLAVTLGVGLLGWAVQAAWPVGCRVLNCTEQALAPYPFTGGWGGEDQFLLLLLFLAAPLGGLLLGLARGRPPGRRAWQVPALLAASGIAVLAGAAWWMLVLAALGWGLTVRLLPGRRAAAERTLLQAVAVAAVFGFVLVYGLEPGYLQRLWSGEATPPPVRVSLPGSPPRGLSSDAPAPLALVLTNLGWRTLPSPPAHPLRLQTRLLVTPQRGTTRTVAGESVTVPGPLHPGEEQALQVLVRIPPWVRDGYLTWTLHTADGRRVPTARGSQAGFRFINAGYRRLTLDPENQLTSLAARAHAFARHTAPPADPAADAEASGSVLGDVLDTLFFSPLWGQPAGDGVPFAAPRPFLPALIHHYGLLGLALALWVALRLFRRAVACGEADDPVWLLAPVSVVLLVAMGLFTQAPATYHGHWAFFLLAGYLEGRYAAKFPRLGPQAAPPRPRPRRMRFRIPLPRLPGRRHHPRRVGAR